MNEESLSLSLPSSLAVLHDEIVVIRYIERANTVTCTLYSRCWAALFSRLSKCVRFRYYYCYWLFRQFTYYLLLARRCLLLAAAKRSTTTYVLTLNCHLLNKKIRYFGVCRQLSANWIERKRKNEKKTNFRTIHGRFLFCLALTKDPVTTFRSLLLFFASFHQKPIEFTFVPKRNLKMPENGLK